MARSKLNRDEWKKEALSAQKELRTYYRDNKNKAPSPKADQWIRQQMRQVRGHIPRGGVKVGRMYMYGYDAKYKHKLPYWDRFPLILCLAVNNTHMLGLNLHYIRPNERAKFMHDVLKFASTHTITNKTVLNINWKTVKNRAVAKQMIKLYIAANVKGGITEIRPADWHKAIFLPTQNFVNTKGGNISATRAYDDKG